MTVKHPVIGALAVLLTAGEFSAFAAQRTRGHDRGGQQTQPQPRTEQREDQRSDGNTARGGDSRAREDRRSTDNRSDNRSDNRNDNRRSDNRRDDRWQNNRGPNYSYRAAPRGYSRGQAPRHYYGSGGSFSVYFGLGSGLRYGAPYRGRVYGYVGPVYGGRAIYYGDVRLEVRPRDAAVYVDGYYAGVVDNFDGVFQRLTLTVGPHQIEVAAPGLEPRFFDVYVDPSRTVSLQADLFDPRSY